VVHLRLNVSLLFYPVVVAETISLSQVHPHYNIEHKKNIRFLCFVTDHSQNNFKEKLSISVTFTCSRKIGSKSSLVGDIYISLYVHITDDFHGPVTWGQTSEYEVTHNSFYFKKRVKKLNTSNLKDLETTLFESRLVSEGTLLN